MTAEQPDNAGQAGQAEEPDTPHRADGRTETPPPDATVESGEAREADSTSHPATPPADDRADRAGDTATQTDAEADLTTGGVEPSADHASDTDSHTGAEMTPTSPAAPSTDDGAENGPAWQRLHPLTVWVNAVVVGAIVLGSMLISAVAVVLAGEFTLWALLLLPAAALVVAAVAGFDMLRLRMTRYRATEERMEMYSGILSRNYRSIPRERIRSVDVNVPLWARLFALCQVTVGTGQHAKAGGDELKLEFVSAAEGDRLRRELLRRGAARTAVTEPGDTGGSSSVQDTHGTKADTTELARLNPLWLGYAALSWASIGLAGAALGGGYSVVSWFGGEWAALLALDVYEFLLAYALLAIPGALLGLLIVGVVAAVALHTEAWWGYRLTRESDDTLRVRRGLLNAKSLSIEERRLRGVRLGQALPLRWFGVADVGAVATGLGTGGQEGSGVAKSALSPPIPRARALEVTSAVLREPTSPAGAELAPHPRAALQRRLVRAAAGVLAVAVAAVVPAWLWEVVPWWPVPVAVGVAVALFVPYAVGSYRGLGHAISGRYLLLRHGMAMRATVALRREAVIGWRVSRSPFQRRQGLATVHATTAAGHGAYPAIDVDLGEGLGFAEEAVPGLLAPFLMREEVERR